jgi:glycerol-3-phosphate cytidylyltransferase
MWYDSDCKLKIILTYGTYDLFHYGHVRLLKRARALGDSLFVGLSSDSFNALKNKQAFMTYEEREELLMSCRFVDRVFPENTWEQKADDIVRYKASVLVMGDDWAGKFDHFSHLCEVNYLERTPQISSTMLRSGLGNYAGSS